MPRILTSTLLALVTTLVAVPAAFAQREVAVVVNPKNPVDSVSSAELRKIFTLEEQHWPGGRKIKLQMQEKGTFEKELVLKKVYGLSETQLRQFWVQKIASLDTTDFPRTWSSSAALKLVVSRYPDAIGFIDASQVDDSVKVLRIDGKRPGQQDYPLTQRSK